MIIAGIGCKKAASAEEILAVIDAALRQHRLMTGQLGALATIAHKGGDPAISEAAERLSLTLILVLETQLESTAVRQLSHSALSLQVAGTPSVSEAAALAAAGRKSRLLGPRIALGPATCAIAVNEAAR